MSRAKVALFLAATGVLVGLVVATASVITGASLCEAGGTGVECYTLTRTLAIRTGVVAGVVTVLMGLLMAGLSRMLSQNEKQRAEQAMEAHRARVAAGRPTEAAPRRDTPG